MRIFWEWVASGSILVLCGMGLRFLWRAAKVVMPATKMRYAALQRMNGSPRRNDPTNAHRYYRGATPQQRGRVSTRSQLVGPDALTDPGFPPDENDWA